MKINYEILADELLSAGMQKVRVKEMVKQVRQDFSIFPELYEDKETREWALGKGFLPGRLKQFWGDLSEETYRKYYADYEYFMAHPLNNHFAIWINDKLTLKYMLNAPGVSQYMPEYYLYVENDGAYSYLMDSPASVKKDEDYLYNLLVEKKHLALKPNNGAGGKGFFGLLYKDGTIYKNGEAITRAELDELKADLNGYIVTEFIQQSSELDKIYAGIACALRIVLYKKARPNPSTQPEYGFLLGYARFGNNKTKAASNNDQGGLSVTLDWDAGKFRGNFRGLPIFWGEEGTVGFRAHPDTGVVLDGVDIPNWPVVKKGLLDICNYLSSLDFFGMDVVITEDGFKLCEINSAPSTGRGQMLYGKCCLDNEDARQFVESKRRPAKKSFLECFNAAIEQE